MKRVIIINGYGTCGKDKFVKLFARKLSLDKELVNISTVDGVKEISKLMGWDGKSKTEKDRQLWSDVKAAMTKYNDGIFTNMINIIDESDDDFFFVHCREPKEIQKFVDYYQFADTCKSGFIECHTLLILRDGVKPPDNPSDKAVMDYNYDFTITNNGTLDDLMNKANLFYKQLTM
jgi:hypothetical protein